MFCRNNSIPIRLAQCKESKKTSSIEDWNGISRLKNSFNIYNSFPKVVQVEMKRYADFLYFFIK